MGLQLVGRYKETVAKGQRVAIRGVTSIGENGVLF